MELRLDTCGRCCSVSHCLALITFLSHLVPRPCAAVLPAHLPTMYLSEGCDQVDLQGLRKLLIHTQRETLYPNNLDCTLLLSVRGGYVMRFTFQHLDLPEPSKGHCEDFVQFHNGYTKELELTRPICGSQPPAPFVSNSSQVVVTFRTNGRAQRAGFRLQAERLEQTMQERKGCSPRQDSGCTVLRTQTAGQEKEAVVQDSHIGTLYCWPVVIGGLVLAWAAITYNLIRR